MSHYKGTAHDAQRMRQLEKQRQEMQRLFEQRQQEIRDGGAASADFTRKFERKVLTYVVMTWSVTDEFA